MADIRLTVSAALFEEAYASYACTPLVAAQAVLLVGPPVRRQHRLGCHEEGPVIFVEGICGAGPVGSTCFN